jgi:S-adenosylmethionine:tRNA ribosyltransferase-isomerase
MNKPPSLPTVSDFDYDLPTELIAQTPLEDRDASRLMIVDRTTQSISHEMVRSFPAHLVKNDLVVVNNTRVLPARIYATKSETGGRVEVLLLHRDPSGTWTCLAKPAKSLKPGTKLNALSDRDSAQVSFEVIAKGADGEIQIRFDLQADDDLDAIGSVPLPPYIREPLASIERYQTTYARIPGSAAAPTAGLHVTDRMRQELSVKHVSWAEVTLHIGLDTFRPVMVDHIEQHRIHREWCSLPVDVVREIHSARSRGGRVAVIGTTSARTLEMWGSRGSPASGFEGWADLFITPGHEWKVVDAMLTNFHLPRSTLLLMVSSFGGIDLIRRAYAEAIQHRYRFYSFGDAMLIL